MSEQGIFQMPVHLDALPSNLMLQSVALSIGDVVVATGYVERIIRRHARTGEIRATNSANRATATTEMWEARPVTP